MPPSRAADRRFGVRLLGVICTVVAGFSCGPVLGAAGDAAFPASPVRIIVPFPPSGATDFVARLMQSRLQEEFGQPVIIENRPGAGGKIAVELAARATPDGHTLLFGSVGSIAINPAVFRSHVVDPLRDLACVNIVADSTAVMVVHPSVPAKSLPELINYAKARPGKINYGAANPASPAHLGMEMLARRSGIELVGILYKGAGDVNIALLSGEVAIATASIPAVLANIRSGQLRALAIKSGTRSDLLPEVPTFKELGFPELTLSSWQGLYAPARTPPARLKVLHRAIARAMQSPGLSERSRSAGVTVLGGLSLEECTAFTRTQVELWGAVAKQVGVAGSL